jgi:hypothetical protein
LRKIRDLIIFRENQAQMRNDQQRPSRTQPPERLRARKARSLTGHIAYEHWWSLRWISNFTYGEADLDLTDTLPDNTYDSATYYTANLIWLPVERMCVGMEVLYGMRQNKERTGRPGHAHSNGLPVQILEQLTVGRPVLESLPRAGRSPRGSIPQITCLIGSTCSTPTSF